MPSPLSPSAAGLARALLVIRSVDQTHSFTIEIARTPGEQVRGLMLRDQLGPDEGMLFPLVPPRPASFWMKNVLFPLDILFVRQDGSIGRIVENAAPMSASRLTFDEPAAAVLEIAGGRSAELGIREGDRAGWPDGARPLW